jgi:hypothetical protein
MTDVLNDVTSITICGDSNLVIAQEVATEVISVSDPSTVICISGDTNAFTVIEEVTNIIIDDSGTTPLPTIITSVDGSIVVVPFVGGFDLSTNGGVQPVILTGSIANDVGAREIGNAISSANLTWSFNKPISAQSLDHGIGSLPVATRARTATISPAVSSGSYSWTLTATDTVTTINPATSFSFSSRRYWGVTASDVELLESEIEAGSSELSSSKAKSRQ